ncbi:MAG: LamG domain-containing protein [Elusimicrobia bacterium]|nr:LamG domain-containing protein [Elusimicrobiota bacterium]
MRKLVVFGLVLGMCISCIGQVEAVKKSIKKKTTTQVQGAKKSTSTPVAGLVGYWKFDEGTGTIANDSSGNGNKGTISGCNWVEGKVKSALEFNGTNAYVNCGNGASLNLTDSMTISAWVKVPELLPQNGIGPIIGKKHLGGTTFGYWLAASEYGIITLSVSNGTVSDSGQSSTKLAANVWQMLTATFSSGKINYYYNGVLFDSDNISASITTISSGSENLAIGASSAMDAGGPYFFKGIIDEVKLYNRALSADEIKAEYNAVAGKLNIKQ